MLKTHYMMHFPKILKKIENIVYIITSYQYNI